MSILEENHQIKKQIDQKFLVFYFRQILKPLSRQKQIDIEKIEKRRDYNLVYGLREDCKDFVDKYFDNHAHLDEEEKQNINEYTKIPWLLSQIENKLNNYYCLSAKIMGKSEQARKMLEE